MNKHSIHSGPLRSLDFFFFFLCIHTMAKFFCALMYNHMCLIECTPWVWINLLIKMVSYNVFVTLAGGVNPTKRRGTLDGGP